MTTFTTHYRILFALLLTVLLGTACSDQETATPSESAEAPAVTSQAPAASQSTSEAQPADVQQVQEAATPAENNSSSTQAAGQKIYKASCQACHASGVAGSPKLGDKGAWAPRVAKGNDELFSSVKNGLKAMPPKGACMACSDDDLRAAMEYMIQQGS